MFCCVPGRSHRKFHAPLHTENVSFILPTGDKRKEKRNERLNWKKKGNPLWLTYVGVTRWNTAMATHTQQSKGGTWSQVQWNVTFMRAKHKGRNFPSKTGARKLKEKCQEFKVFLTLDQIFFSIQGRSRMHLKVHSKSALKEMHFKLVSSLLHCKLSEQSLFSIVPLWDKFEVRSASCENGELSACADRGAPVLWSAERFALWS